MKDNFNYEIPFKLILRYNIKYLILFLIMGILFIACFFIPNDFFKQDDFLMLILTRYFLPLLGLFFLVVIINNNLLKLSYFEIHQDKFILKSIFKTITIFWKDIAEFNSIRVNHNTLLSFRTFEKINKLKNNLPTFINELFGGNYSAQISTLLLKNYDIERLVIIFGELIEKNRLENNENEIINGKELNDNALNDQISNKFQKFFLFSFLSSFILGFIYGLSIFLLKINLLFIPFIMIIIFYYYFSKFIMSINIFHRLYLLIINFFFYFICVATLFSVSLFSENSFTLNNLFQIFNVFFSKPSESLVIFGILSVITGFSLFFINVEFGFIKKIKSFFNRNKNI